MQREHDAGGLGDNRWLGAGQTLQSYLSMEETEKY